MALDKGSIFLIENVPWGRAAQQRCFRVTSGTQGKSRRSSCCLFSWTSNLWSGWVSVLPITWSSLSFVHLAKVNMWMPYPWKCSRPGWIWLWATWSSGRCQNRGLGNGWSLSALPIQTIPWFFLWCYEHTWHVRWDLHVSPSWLI